MTKPLTPRQADCVARLRAFDRLAFLDDAAAGLRGRWREHFAAGIGPTFDGRLVVEIGSADGSLLARVAARCPRTAFVGLDWKYGDTLRAAERIAAAELPNVAIVRGRARDLRRFFADREVDEFWIFHPDPCASAIERPNRLIDESFLLDVATLMRGVPSSLAIKTDHAGYFQSTLALLGLREPDWPTLTPRVRLRDLEPAVSLPAFSDAVARVLEMAHVATDFTGDAAAQAHVASRAFAGEATPYEVKFVAKRQPIFYVELRRRDAL